FAGVEEIFALVHIRIVARLYRIQQVENGFVAPWNRRWNPRGGARGPLHLNSFLMKVSQANVISLKERVGRDKGAWTPLGSERNRQTTLGSQHRTRGSNFPLPAMRITS